MDEAVKKLYEQWMTRGLDLRSGGEWVAGTAVEECAVELRRCQEDLELFWGTMSAEDHYQDADSGGESTAEDDLRGSQDRTSFPSQPPRP